jgi:hypothetical protein
MLKYKLSFSNQIGEDYTVFLDYKNFTGSETVLTGTADALVIRSINNDDDRFSPILSKELVLSFHIPVTLAISIQSFLVIEDDECHVTVFRHLAQPPIFKGYLVVEDSSQPLHDRPYQITLRASDGLSLLKNTPLKRTDGSNFGGLNNLTDYIGHILYKVNPTVTTKVYFDIYHVDMDLAFSPLEQMQVDAKTFEKDETSFIDCYTVLEYILNSCVCRLFFENGYWHVVSLWQYRNITGFSWIQYYVANDIVVKGQAATSDVIVASVGNGKLIRAIEKDAVIYYKVANKSVKRTFHYDLPKEIICNQFLLRGDKIPSLSTSTYDAFALNCWEHYRNGVLGNTPPVQTAYIKREFDAFNYEKDRYIVLPTESNNAFSAHLRSSTFYVDKNDKVTIGAEFRKKNQYSGTQTVIVYYVFLKGDNGQNYTLDDDGKWYLSNSSFSLNTRALQYSYDGSANDKITWNTKSVEGERIPVTGTIQLRFLEDSSAGFPNETWIKNIQITYEQWIKESYAPVLGDYNLYEQNLNINRTLEEDVQISDSPKKIIKGAIFLNNSLATPEWYRFGIAESLRFMQVMTRIKYNYTFKQFQKIEGSLKGLSLLYSSQNIPFGFLPQYSFTDIPNNSALKYILTSMEVDYYTGHWRGVFVEVQNRLTLFDKYEFNYLFK